MTTRTLRNIKRLNKIAVTLIRWGFGGLVTEIRLLPFVSTIDKIFVSRKRFEGLSIPERIRKVLEELGPTFIKLGQIASTRADLLPSDWIQEFKKLQDMVPPFPFEAVKKTVERSLKAPIPARFKSFDPVPVASASIAQVHHAVLTDGTEVAVKVKRPGIGDMVDSDMSVMHIVAALLEKYIPASRRYKPKEVVSEFERVITNEQDLSAEGVNINRFYNLFNGNPDIQIPKVYWDYTTEEVLTMERISGTPIDEIETLKAKGIDIKTVAIKGLGLFFKQVFEFGVFHADLHPGNIFVRDDGVIIYLDFGIIGRLDSNLRKYLAGILYYMVRKNYYRMAMLHRVMGLIGDGVAIREFEEALRDITEPIFGRTLEQIHISSLLMKLLHAARRFDMTMQPNLLLLQKSMVIIEGVGRQLYPDVNMWEVAKPLIYKWMMREKFSPKAILGRGRERADDLVNAAIEVPVKMNNILNKALREDLRVRFVLERFDEVVDEIEYAGKRAAGAFLAGALVIGAAVVMAFPGRARTIFGMPVLSLAGFILAFILGIRFLTGDSRKR